MEIALRQKDAQLFKLKEDITTKSDIIASQKSELEKAKKEIAALNEKIVRKIARSENLPTKVTASLTALIAILTTTSKDIFGLLSNFQQTGVLPSFLIPSIFWILFFFFGKSILKKHYREIRMNTLLDYTCTAEMRSEFRAQIKGRYFTEIDATEIIHSKNIDVYSGFRPLYLLKKWFVGSLSKTDIDQMSRAFVSKLEEDGLIQFQGVSKFLRVYNIIDDSSWVF